MTTMDKIKHTDAVTVADVAAFIEELAPLPLAESWDHCGLQIGDPSAPLEAVVLALDFTPEALDLARSIGAGLILTHHPAIFHALPYLRATDPEQSLVMDAVRAGCAVYSAHTNLDSAVGGVNDALMASLGFTASKTLIPHESITGRADLVITRPIPASVLPGMIRMVDFMEMLNESDAVAKASSLPTTKGLAAKINHDLQTAGVMINFDTDTPVRRFAVSGGSFDSDWIPVLAEHEVDLILSGEIRYHDMLSLRARGIAAIAAGHDCSERIVLQPLAAQLRVSFPGLRVEVHGGLDYNKIVY